MSQGVDPARLQAVLAALVARRIEESLARVEVSISAWRAGETDVLGAHAEALRHAARASALSGRVARAGIDGPDALLRDAFDAGLITEDEFHEMTGKAPSEVDPPPALEDESVEETRAAMPAKRSVVDKLLQDGAVLLHLDARREEVDVPSPHEGDPKLVLRIGYGLTPVIPDLVVDEDGVRATLTFRGMPHLCVVPWAAVYAVVSEDGRGLVWPEDVPPEVARDFAHDTRPSPPSESPRGDGDGDGDGEPEPPKPRRGSHLKLV
jgi:stringent starvation protein B